MILLSGHPKTGNTWTRFIIYNYFNIYFTNAQETLTYKDITKLNEVPFLFEFTHLPYSGKMLFRTQNGSKKYYESFSSVIYVYRNPFDTMISYWYYIMNRKPGVFKEPFKSFYEKLVRIDDFVKVMLPLFIDHLKSTFPIADLKLNYDDLRKNTNEFKNLIKLFFNDIDQECFERTINLSSFENIKKMGIQKHQTHGLAIDYLGHFTRDGRTRQYKEIMTDDLINYIKDECKKENLDQWNFNEW